MQSALSRIWTCVAVSISYDDNYYTTGTSKTSVMNQMTYLRRNASVFGVLGFLRRSQLPLKDKFIGCGLILSHLWRDRRNTYANFCPPSLHIKRLILLFGKCVSKQRKLLSRLRRVREEERKLCKTYSIPLYRKGVYFLTKSLSVYITCLAT